jgi:hypothetical protein
MGEGQAEGVQEEATFWYFHLTKHEEYTEYILGSGLRFTVFWRFQKRRSRV